MKSRSLLQPLLVLVGIHSIIVGILLILFPPSMMGSFGYTNINEPFFMRQGGIFHLVMSVAYIMAAYYYMDQKSLIGFTIIAKLFATLFLFSYFLFVSKIWMVLASGLGDALMGLLIFILFRTEQKRIKLVNGKI